MIRRRQHKYVAVVVGALAAGVPVAMIHRGLDAYIERQATEEVRLSTRRAIARAEWRLGQAIAALSEIGKAGLKSCTDIDPGAVFELLREGQRVEFTPEDSQKGPRAGDVRLIEG